MINRPLYVDRIMAYTDTPFVKVLTGVHRCGKSTILKMIMEKLQQEHGIPAERIVSMRFDSMDYEDMTAKDMFKAVKEKLNPTGRTYLFLDEIQEIEGWEKVVNSLATDYDVDLYVTGSNSRMMSSEIATYLTGRYVSFRIYTLSFREYLAISRGYRLPVYSLEDILKNKVDFPYNLERPLQLFKEYLQQGYYPFFKEKGYYIRLRSILNQALENDIPIFAKMNITTAQKLKRLLYIIAQSVPFKPNFTKLAALLDINRNTISELIFYLEKAGIINQLRCDTEGIRLLGKVDKVYLNNTNLAYALSDSMPDIGNIRETVFFSLMRATQPITTSSCSDFSIGKYTFEIGGKGKSQKQIQNIENSYIVKDDIEFGMQNIIPLWMFGFTY